MHRRWRVCCAVAVVLVGGSCAPEVPIPTNTAPTAAASGTPSSGTVPLVVAFSSAGSFDSDGSIVSYAWTFGDGGTSTQANPTHTFASASTFVTTLVVTDNGGATGSATATTVVNPAANQSPTAVGAATPTSGHAPLNVAFDSSASSDSDGTIAAVEWDFGDGSPVSTQTNPSHVYSAAGSFVAQLTVTDNDGATNVDTIVITVDPNESPSAAASATPTSGKAPLTVVFSSTGSMDPDGTIVSYDWDFGDGSAHSTSASPTHQYVSVGLVTATLTVTDNGGATDSATVDVQVSANQLPTAIATSDVSSGSVPLTVQFDGSTSSDADGSIASYLWDFGDGNQSSLAAVAHTFGSIGTYAVTLTVTDNDGADGVATIAITVGPPPNVAPTASAGVTPVLNKVGVPFGFSAAGSSDSDGSIVSYDWDFGDGQTSTSANPSHAYAVAASYTAVLTVTDDRGGTDTDSVQVVVINNVAPNAVATATPPSGKVPLAVSFAGSSSDDPDGTIVSYDWDFGDGAPHGVSADVSHTYTGAGTYLATLTVTDDNGSIDSATASVVVAANQPPVAALNVDVVAGKAPLSVTFDSGNSIDPDGTVVSRVLDFGDGTPTTTTTVSPHVYANPGTFTATLTVTDDNGDTNTATRVIEAVANVAPTAAAQSTPSSGLAPLAVSLTSVGSTDSDGSIANFSWTFGDGGSANGPTVSHTYQIAGQFTAQLTVTDDNGATATASVVIDSVGAVLNPTSGAPGSSLTVTLPCSPAPGHPTIATAIVALVSSPGGIVASTASLDNSSTGNPLATVTLNVPVGTPSGNYVVTSSCDTYMSNVQFAPAPYQVT